MNRSKILMLYPPRGHFTDYNTPTGTLYVATVLKEKGYNVKFIDCSIEADYHAKITNELDGTLCVGAYCMSVHIKHLVPLLQEIKEARPDVKVVLGGPHPTLFPESTAKDELVDFAVRGEGEETMLELVKTLERKETDFSDIKGICYKQDDSIISTPPREFLDLDSLPFVDWNLMSSVALESMASGIARVQTSRGCPFRCAFCINAVTNNRKMRYRSPTKVVDEIEHLVKSFGVKRIGIRDEIFLVNRDQVREIAEEIIRRGVKITWIANPHIRLLRETWIDDEFLGLLVQSGCNKLQGGGESGSQRILDMLHKMTTPDDILNFVKRARRHGITPLVSFLTGVPGETKEELLETLRLIWKILEIEPRTTINGPAMYRPYPGGELFDECVREYGLKMPETLSGWVHLEMIGGPRPPWVENIYFTQNLWTHVIFASYSKSGQLGKICRGVLGKRGVIRGVIPTLAVFVFAKLAVFRLKHCFYKFPIEFWLLHIYWRIRGEIPELS